MSKFHFAENPIFDLGFHPTDRTSTQRDLFWKISLIYKSINRRLSKTGKFYYLRKTNSLIQRRHEIRFIRVY